MLLGLSWDVKAKSQDETLAGWNKAYGLWGKRSLTDESFYAQDMFGSEQKRPATENWSKLSTLWGKRLVIFGLKYNITKEKTLIGKWRTVCGGEEGGKRQHRNCLNNSKLDT
ncbi:hypothetical protein WR25_13344 [Diploscapter pachys]|uniref:Uncharacterized protein n=1 Tax=Diploscapter pachys TaxID=2018661 RepID=A0A2A2JHK6_9BILA|nr:hypothetical protein WR25_13344 [Diploscapter pachys]